MKRLFFRKCIEHMENDFITDVNKEQKEELDKYVTDESMEESYSNLIILT